MATVNELKYQALIAFAPGTINELEIAWLVSLGHTAPKLNELWHQEFVAGGAAPGAWNQMAYEYLGIKGATAPDLSSRWYQFWAGGGSDTPTLISNTDAVAALWTVRGTNTVVDAANDVEITNVDDNGGCYLRLSTTTILSEALVDGVKYRIAFRSKTAGIYYLGLTSQPGNRVMNPGLNGVEFKPQGSVDLTAAFLNISLPAGPGQVEAIGHPVLVWKLP